jgi:hypothetical protein
LFLKPMRIERVAASGIRTQQNPRILEARRIRAAWPIQEAWPTREVHAIRAA